MRKNKYCLLIVAIIFLSVRTYSQQKEITLPKPSYKGNLTFEELIYKWKATRRFSTRELTTEQLSQLLWSAVGFTIDGITSATRVYPSAGAIYPLELYVVCGNIKLLEPGIYKYDPQRNSIKLIKKGDFREDLTKAAYGQFFISQAPVSFVWVADYNIVNKYYGQRGTTRYVHTDLGHSAQNLTLQATALGLGTVQVGAFNDDTVRNLLGLSKDKTPVYIMPVGYPK
ncbi:MAG: SagB/ThcOx family dehydrogenase [Endomicrobia bacterium]|nr:SagB/ThcOx family dehydrogenase [Endomicrobiia bacterium]MCX7940236.1 SagB/ThcOx family dehydrogenase [Endomicrobiia bacterium]MDW8056438.1 SagB/ThcOx family dehydrogenase [Elusimicrobiota bacterium]